MSNIYSMYIYLYLIIARYLHFVIGILFNSLLYYAITIRVTTHIEIATTSVCSCEHNRPLPLFFQDGAEVSKTRHSNPTFSMRFWKPDILTKKMIP